MNDSKLYKAKAGVIRNASEDQLQAIFFGLAGEDRVLTAEEFKDFAGGSKPGPEAAILTDELWRFLNRVKEEMKNEDEDEDGGGMESSIIRQLTFVTRCLINAAALIVFVFLWRPSLGCMLLSSRGAASLKRHL